MVHVNSPEVDRTVTEDGTRFRALFISDVHLGTSGCQAERLLDFLRYHDADRSIWSATSSTAGS